MKRLALSVVLGLTLVLGLVTAGVLGTAATPTAVAATTRPNIVLVLMDDFSLELLRTMPQARALAAAGASYENAFVVDSLCCPSRTALLTGRYPHQTGVLLNTPNGTANPIGGYAAFDAHDNEGKAINLSLRRNGYATGFVGKFLNGYEPVRRADGSVRPPALIPGWDRFNAVLGGGYSGWGFVSTYQENGQQKLQRHPKPPAGASAAVKDRAYAQTVISRKAVDFIRDHRDGGRPYFLEIAPYAPHAHLNPAYDGDPLFPPAFRDRPTAANPGGNCGARRCGDLRVGELSAWHDPSEDNRPVRLRADGSTTLAPAWNDGNPLGAEKALRHYRNRARMVQSIDRMLGQLRREIGPDTYLVLTSDNGYHLGGHSLGGGKGTAYDHDTNVPLVVTGPGVVPGSRSQFVENIDLAPTFEQLAGVVTPTFRSGRSFAASLRNPLAVGDEYAFIEHTWSKTRSGEVDADLKVGADLGSIPSYTAVRSARGLLVRLDLDNGPGTSYAWELYRASDEEQTRNVFAAAHDEPWAVDLRRRLTAFVDSTPTEARRLAG